MELSKEISTFFFDLKKNFTQFHLKVALSLKSKYAKRIYEMLCQYKNTGVLRMSLLELRKRLNLIDSETGKRKYTKHGLFREKVLEVAKKELTQKSDITFSYQTTKTGKKYTHLCFKIKDNTQVIPKNHNIQAYTEDLEETFKKLVGSYQLSSWQARKIVQYVPFKEIHTTAYSIKLEIINNKIHNIGGYTAKVFDQKYELGLFRNG